ncbi:EAL domain-containing protein [Salmonella enterica]|nr:EAL domain-containing protein [Salmonella enterica]
MAGLLVCLCISNKPNLILSIYYFIWLLPVMLWGAIKIGHSFISLVWVIIQLLISYHINDTLLVKEIVALDNYLIFHALSSTIVFIFSLTIVVIGVLSAKNSKQLKQLFRLHHSEPNTGLANFKSLRLDSKKEKTEGLCHIRFPELKNLEKIHGIEFNYGFVKNVVVSMRSFLLKGESIYYDHEGGIIIRIKMDTDINHLFIWMKSFRYNWKEGSLGLTCGISFTFDNDIIKDLSSALHLLNVFSYKSTHKGAPLLLNKNTINPNIISSGSIRNSLQEAIDKKSFILMAQPIVPASVINEPLSNNKHQASYNEILIRLKTSDNKFIYPDTFLPLARDAGLLPLLDSIVIEQTFAHMNKNKNANLKYSINITPEAMIYEGFTDKVLKLLKEYEIDPSHIIFEVIESDILDSNLTSLSLTAFHEAGIKVAIDDFGTESSSYSRLKNINANILKIDGSFIKNILSDDFSRCAVKSFCEIAKLKKMEVVAEFVESHEIACYLTSIGVGWLQGYYIGKPLCING